MAWSLAWREPGMHDGGSLINVLIIVAHADGSKHTRSVSVVVESNPIDPEAPPSGAARSRKVRLCLHSFIAHSRNVSF